MALTVDEIASITSLQTLVQSLVTILDNEDGSGEVTAGNITNLNTTLTNALTAIDDIIAPAP